MLTVHSDSRQEIKRRAPTLEEPFSLPLLLRVFSELSHFFDFHFLEENLMIPVLSL